MYRPIECSKSSRARNADSTVGLSSPVQALALHLADDVLTLYDLPEDNVLSVQVGSRNELKT